VVPLFAEFTGMAKGWAFTLQGEMLVHGFAVGAKVGVGITHRRVHLLLDHSPLLPLEAGHAGHAVIELAIGEAKSDGTF
jgi:hypothetical protein